MLVTRARDTSSFLAFCNLVGGQDELVFDGHSVVLDDAGEVVARAPGFEEHLLVVDVEPTSPSAAGSATSAGASSTAPARRVPAVEILELARAPSHASRSTAPVGAVRARARADAPRAHPRAARLRREERIRARRRRQSPAGSTPPSRRRSASTPSAPSACTASRCRRGSRPRARGRTHGALAENLGCDFREIPIEDVVEAFHERARTSRRAGLEGLRPRTSRRACAASCSWRSRTRTAGSSSRPGTSRSSRSATRRSTGTWSAGSRSSRTCSRRTSSGSRAT